MIVTTTPAVEGRKITDYHGIVTGEAIIGANLFRGVFAKITDILGGHSGAFEATRAVEMDATEVVGVDPDYEVIDNMLMVSASGIAVSLG